MGKMENMGIFRLEKYKTLAKQLITVNNKIHLFYWAKYKIAQISYNEYDAHTYWVCVRAYGV